MHHLKNKISVALESNDLTSIATLARGNKKVLSHLVRFAYDKETLLGWRAIKAIGLVAKAIVNEEYSFLRETIRKLLWSLSDESGGIGWSAPEIIGEIVCSDPDRFQDIVPIISGIYEIEEEVFRPGILYALSRVAEQRPDLVLPHQDLAIRALDDRNPLTRYYGLEIMTRIKSSVGPSERIVMEIGIKKLLTDKSEVWVYKDNDFSNIHLSEAASGLLNI
jgi:hypothetical protein